MRWLGSVRTGGCEFEETLQELSRMKRLVCGMGYGVSESQTQQQNLWRNLLQCSWPVIIVWWCCLVKGVLESHQERKNISWDCLSRRPFCLQVSFLTIISRRSEEDEEKERILKFKGHGGYFVESLHGRHLHGQRMSLEAVWQVCYPMMRPLGEQLAPARKKQDQIQSNLKKKTTNEI